MNFKIRCNPGSTDVEVIIMSNYKETRLKVFNRDGWICKYPHCFSREIECAHGIARTKANTKMIIRLWREMFGENIKAHQAQEILNCEDNLSTSCHTHNSYFNFGNQPERVKEFLRRCKKLK